MIKVIFKTKDIDIYNLCKKYWELEEDKFGFLDFKYKVKEIVTDEIIEKIWNKGGPGTFSIYRIINEYCFAYSYFNRCEICGLYIEFKSRNDWRKRNWRKRCLICAEKEND